MEKRRPVLSDESAAVGIGSAIIVAGLSLIAYGYLHWRRKTSETISTEADEGEDDEQSQSIPEAPAPLSEADWKPPPIEPASKRRADGRIGDLTPAKQDALVTVQGHSLEARTADAYLRMLQAARQDGIQAPYLNVQSGYRSPESQMVRYKRALAKYREKLRSSLNREPTEAEVEKETRRWVAPPGNSAHQTGRAIDLNVGMAPESENVEKARNSDAYKWLKQHAQDFGFYPYAAEPWHWEYNP